MTFKQAIAFAEAVAKYKGWKAIHSQAFIEVEVEQTEDNDYIIEVKINVSDELDVMRMMDNEYFWAVVEVNKVICKHLESLFPVTKTGTVLIPKCMFVNEYTSRGAGTVKCYNSEKDMISTEEERKQFKNIFKK